MNADLILIARSIHDGLRFRPDVQAVAVKGSKIVALGSRQEVGKLQGPQTQLLHRPRALLMPAFCDSHIHLYDWALAQQRLDLRAVSSLEELKHTVEHAVRQLAQDQWLLGQGWNETQWPQPRLPARADLDPVSGERPVVLWRSDLHLAVANSAALRRAGIYRNTEDPPHGVIDRAPDGEPTGVVRERAIDLLRAAIPPPASPVAARAVEKAARRLHAMGVLTVHDARLMDGGEGPRALAAYRRLAQLGQLPLRIWAMLSPQQLEHASEQRWVSGAGDESLHIGHLKLFADGSQGARTAWMLEPYLDSGDHGLPLMEPAELATWVRRAAAQGIAPAIHAIGDRAVRTVIRLLANVLPPSARAALNAPPRIEHLQNVRPADVQALSRLGAVASMQPIHLVDDMAMMARSVGERARFAYPFADLLRAGVPLAFGSDAPVADPDPLRGLQAALTRQTPAGEPQAGWYPEQRITLEQALAAYTSGPARACGLEHHQGRIAPGCLADLVLIGPDLRTLPADQILHARVEAAILGGRPLFDLGSDGQ